jgi:hypothetical protein
MRTGFVNNVYDSCSNNFINELSQINQLVFTDTFTDADNTLLYQAVGYKHTSDSGHNWIPQTGFAPTNHARIHNNRLMPQSSLNVYRADFVMDNPNYEVEAVLDVLTNAGSIGVNARASSVANTFYNWRYSSNTWFLAKAVAGTQTTLATFSQTLTAGQTVTAKLLCNGSIIEGYVDNVLRASAIDTDITGAGSVGVRSVTAVTTTTGVHMDSITATLI